MLEWERRKKAKDQPRDSFGRWIATGANVTWKAPDSKGKAGTVKSVKNGMATLDVRNPDGTKSEEAVPTKDITVVASKARLPEPENEYYAGDNDFNSVLGDPKFQSGLEVAGRATIKRADGYALEASIRLEKESGGNPIIYQLFAPAGKSLGTYTSSAIGDFNDMVAEHIAQLNPAKALDGKKPIAPEAPAVPDAPAVPSGPIAASGVPVRLSRDGTLAIFKNEENLFSICSAKDGSQLKEPTADFSTLVAGGSWRKVTQEESVGIIASLAPKDSIDIVVEQAEVVKPYRVPPAVKEAISTALTAGAKSISAIDLEKAKNLAYSESVSIKEVEWIESFFASQEIPEKLRGGYHGKKWASKILDSFPIEEPEPKHDFSNSKLSYFAIGTNPDSVEVNDILAVSFDTDEVYTWGEAGFSISESVKVDDIDEPNIVPIDEFTAESLASWKDSREDATKTFNLADADPLERNLFELALSELDLEELEAHSAIIAAGEVTADTGYTPLERSINAKKQIRGPGGKFGSGGNSDAPAAADATVPGTAEATAAPGTTAAKAKAKLTIALPPVASPAQRILEWIDVAPITAAGEVMPTVPATEAAADTEEAEPATDVAEALPESKSLYFAIVDDVDKSAVLDVVAITKNDLSEPEAWLRQNASWVASEPHLASLQGPTPPPVVELMVPNPAKEVLAQIDNYDVQGASAPNNISPVAAPAPVAPVVASADTESRKKDAKKGFALPSGAYPIHDVKDLENAIKAFGRAKESEKAEVRAHIKKRAKALNRMDLIPETWREMSVADRAFSILNQTPLFGDYGEVITAAGGGGITGEARLKAYWQSGKGAAKIRWGTDGDLTRCHSHLEKYIPGLAWGFCQNLHKGRFAKSNYKRDHGQ